MTDDDPELRPPRRHLIMVIILLAAVAVALAVLGSQLVADSLSHLH